MLYEEAHATLVMVNGDGGREAYWLLSQGGYFAVGYDDDNGFNVFDVEKERFPAIVHEMLDSGWQIIQDNR